jgi:hypothetical protein
MLQFIAILEHNQVLMDNTKNILETFPEAVIIRGSSQDSNGITDLFVNDCARQTILSDDMKFRVSKLNDQNEDHSSIENFKTYSEVLETYEGNVFHEDNEDDQIELVPGYTSSLNLDSQESKYYSIKTIRVTWEN